MVPVMRDRSGPTASLVTPALLEQVRERAEPEGAVEAPEHELAHLPRVRLQRDPVDRSEEVPFHLLLDADADHGG